MAPKTVVGTVKLTLIGGLAFWLVWETHMGIRGSLDLLKGRNEAESCQKK